MKPSSTPIPPPPPTPLIWLLAILGAAVGVLVSGTLIYLLRGKQINALILVGPAVAKGALFMTRQGGKKLALLAAALAVLGALIVDWLVFHPNLTILEFCTTIPQLPKLTLIVIPVCGLIAYWLVACTPPTPPHEKTTDAASDANEDTKRSSGKKGD